MLRPHFGSKLREEQPKYAAPEWLVLNSLWLVGESSFQGFLRFRTAVLNPPVCVCVQPGTQLPMFSLLLVLTPDQQTHVD